MLKKLFLIVGAGLAVAYASCRGNINLVKSEIKIDSIMAEVMNQTDYEKHRTEMLKAIKANPNDWEAIASLVCIDQNLCLENVRPGGHNWKNGALGEEMIELVAKLMDSGVMDDDDCKGLYGILNETENIMFDHKRLIYRMAKARQELMSRISDKSDEVKQMQKSADKKVETYGRMIELADNGKLKEIAKVREEIILCKLMKRESEEIKGLEAKISKEDMQLLEDVKGGSWKMETDWVEWTAEYEKVIDEAEQKVESKLKGHSHGMGFCHLYWGVKREVLEKDYGIKWRSPSQMNPRVMFD